MQTKRFLYFRSEWCLYYRPSQKWKGRFWVFYEYSHGSPLALGDRSGWRVSGFSVSLIRALWGFLAVVLDYSRSCLSLSLSLFRQRVWVPSVIAIYSMVCFWVRSPVFLQAFCSAVGKGLCVHGGREGGREEGREGGKWETGFPMARKSTWRAKHGDVFEAHCYPFFT